MAFTKTNRTEKVRVLTPETQQVADEALQRMGKTSAQNLTDEERAELRRAIENRN